MPFFSPQAPSGGGTSLAIASGTTGSPSINTVARPGKTIYDWTGSGSITISTAGTCEVFVLGGGGAGGGFGIMGGLRGGAGGGGYLYNTTAYLPVGTTTITVGAGGAVNTSSNDSPFPGNPSQCGNYVATGGSAPIIFPTGNTRSGGFSGQGNAGGSVNGSGINGYQSGSGAGGGGGATTPVGGAGGGGAGGAGGSTVTGSTTGGAGGSGAANSVLGSSVTWGGGGGAGVSGGGGSGGGGAGATSTAGAGSAGTGGLGGGGGGGGSLAGGAGGSGRVIVVIG